MFLVKNFKDLLLEPSSESKNDFDLTNILIRALTIDDLPEESIVTLS